MISLSTDTADLVLQRTLYNTLGLNNSVERMTTGYKLNHAKDNAAGYSIVKNLSVKISSLLQVQQNTEDGIALLQTAQGGLEEIEGLLGRLRDLSVEAANGTYGAQAREAMQREADAIIEQITQLRENIQYDNRKLFYVPKDSDSEVSKGVTRLRAANIKTAASLKSKSLARAAAAPLTANAIEGAITFAARETKTITIDNITYEVTSRNSNSADLSYKKDESTGQVTFMGSSFTIHAQKDVQHNVLIQGRGLYFYGGDLDDYIEESSVNVGNSPTNKLYGGAGNDTITVRQTGAQAYGEAGEDILYAKRSGTAIYGGDDNDTIYADSSCTAYGGAGNDTIHVNSSSNIYGDDGDDIFNINSHSNVYGGGGNDIYNINNCILNSLFEGGEGDDVFNIKKKLSLRIDGGGGANVVNGEYNDNSIVINVDKSNMSGINLDVNESQSIQIDGISYELTNASTASKTIMYKTNSLGQIEFSTLGHASGISIKGQADKEHNVVLMSRFTFYGGDLGDNIIAKINDCRIYAGEGNNNISTGNDSTFISVGNGNNTISVGSNTTITTGNGDNEISIGNNSVLTVGKGSNQIVARGSNNYINCLEGNNNVELKGSYNFVFGTAGNNTAIDNGSNNFINGFGDADTAEAVIARANSKNNVVTIDNVEYTFNNNYNGLNALFYSKNPITGQITFGLYRIYLYGQKDVQHDVIVRAYAGTFTGGDLDDTIVGSGSGGTIYGGAGNDNITVSSLNAYGEDGDDNIVLTGGGGALYGGNGNDTITVNAGHSSVSVNGGTGDDTYNINAVVGSITDTAGNNIYNINANQISVTGSPDADTFYIKGNNNTIMGSGGDDYFIIDGENNNIDGGTGDNIYVDNGVSNTKTNSETDPNSGVLTFDNLGEIKSFECNGKTYTVTNNLADKNVLQYSINPLTSIITINGSDFAVDAQSNQTAILNIRGDNNVINGSNLADKIVVEQGSNNTINGLGGNDVLTMESENNSLFGGEGNDRIILNASTDLEVNGGNGADTLDINSSNNTNINAGLGDDIINVKTENNTINANEGGNRINVSADNNEIQAGNGDNKFVITSSSNTITAGSGNNSIGIQGDNNNLTAENAGGDINIYGNGNSVTNTSGENKVTIKGNSNIYNSLTGKKEVNVNGNSNEVVTGDGDDKFEIKGNSNSIESQSGANEISVRGSLNNIQGGDGADNIKINGNNNTASGGDQDDSFMVSGGNSNSIDGNGGKKNTLIDNGANTTYTNAVDITPHPFEAELKVDIGGGNDKFIKTSISFNLFDFSVDFSSIESSLDSIELVDEMIAQVSDQLIKIGSTINRLETVLDAQSIKLENMISARSTLQDADIAEESSAFIKYQILQQASSALTASSRNIKAENVLGLLNRISA